MSAVQARDLPKIIAASPRRIDRAAAKTLTGLAFDSIPIIVDRAQEALDFQLNARRALGMRVIRKARPDSLQAEVGTGRGWLYYHLNSGTRRPAQGFPWKGRRWLIYPLREEFVVKRGRRRGHLKAAIMRRSFVMPTRSGAVMAWRPRRGAEMEIVAILSQSFRHRVALSPEQVIAELMKSKGRRLFRLFLEKERARDIARHSL